MLDIVLIDAMDRVGEDVMDNKGTCSLLDITLIDLTNDDDVCSPSDSEFVLFTDSM